MPECYDEGRLRAYLDQQSSTLEQAAIANHLSSCPHCRTTLSALAATAQHAASLLVADAPDPAAALAQFRAAQPMRAPRTIDQGGQTVNTRSRFRIRGGWLATGLVAVVMLSLLAFPPVRAAADSLLQIFRVRSVVLVPIDQSRVEQLKNLDLDGKQLLVSKPTIVGSHEPQIVADASAVSNAVGFPIGQIASLPSPATSSTYGVLGAQTANFQVNVDTAREILRLLDVKDVTLPDSLGQSPITVKTTPIATTMYATSNYTATLIQGRSPEVNVPDGVDLQQLGNAALQVLGMPAEQAKAMASSIDWSSTLLVPVPANVNAVQQLTINSSPALLASAGDTGQGDEKVLYWQNGDQFYAIKSYGLSDNELIAAAQSVR